jgi:glycosyltransferase involved in cell wall biosynthesis
VTGPAGLSAPVATSATPSPGSAPAGVVPQRCVLVLPSTAEFDSRTYRIASTLASRGHDVTVVARLAPGLPPSERHPAGYRILRVPVSATAGLPWPLRPIVLATRRRARPALGSTSAAQTARASDAEAKVPGPGVGAPGASVLGRVRRLGAGFARLAAIALTVRAQRIATRRVAPTADLVHAMAYMGIPVGLDLGRRDGAPVVYDARDIYVDAANLARLPRPARRLFARIERGWARRASRVVTVNVPYAEVMADRFGVPMPIVVLNCSYVRKPAPTRPSLIRDRLDLDPATPVVLYQGGFSRDRGIEQLIAALPALPGVALVLLGYGTLHAELETRAAEPDLAGRLHVLPAVPPTELLDWVASADVVAMPIQPATLNHRLTTPNKLFEAMSAGVPVVASDLPGMAGIVRETGCGVLVDPTDPAAIGAAIRGLLGLPAGEREAIGRRGYAAHLATYNWEAQSAALIAEYGRLTGRPW